MRTTSVTGFWSVSVAVIVISASGCATPALWKCTASRDWSPGSPDQILLITDTNQQRDVLVFFRQFDCRPESRDSRTVGWRLGQSPLSLAFKTNDITRITNAMVRCESIPIFDGEETPTSSTNLLSSYAIWHSLDQELTVHIEGIPAGPFTLPSSHQPSQPVLRACMLPVALSADAALIGAVAFAACLANPGYVAH